MLQTTSEQCGVGLATGLPPIDMWHLQTRADDWLRGRMVRSEPQVIGHVALSPREQAILENALFGEAYHVGQGDRGQPLLGRFTKSHAAFLAIVTRRIHTMSLDGAPADWLRNDLSRPRQLRHTLIGGYYQNAHPQRFRSTGEGMAISWAMVHGIGGLMGAIGQTSRADVAQSRMGGLVRGDLLPTATVDKGQRLEPVTYATGDIIEYTTDIIGAGAGPGARVFHLARLSLPPAA